MNGYLSMVDAAKALGVSSNLVTQWIREKEFPKTKVKIDGNKLVVSEKSLFHYLKNRKLSGRGPKPRWLSKVGHKAAKVKTSKKAA